MEWLTSATYSLHTSTIRGREMKALVCIAVAGFCLVTSTLHAQDIEARLAGSATSYGFSVLDNNRLQLFTVRGNGRVGIGTVTPDASLHVIGQIKITGGNPGAGMLLTSDADGLATWQTPAGSGVTLDAAYDHGGQGAGRTITADAGAVRVAGVDGFLVTGTSTSGSIPATGAGVRMMFYPRKAAFRAGLVTGTHWDDANIGYYSAAMGSQVTASGGASTAMGYGTTASNDYSTAMGYATTASGSSSTATGDGTIASGLSSTAMGSSTT
ncbi:MAG: hypothetical protein JXA28_04175, partial [Bacteroidetes bacterium]|nr:hypothetical protein [Bacteroidota bacterium]